MFDRFNLWLGGLVAGMQALREREEGQALVEYGLLLALIAVVAVASLTTLGGKIVDELTKIATDI